MYGKGALMISEFIRKADLCKKSIDALRPLEGQMLKQVKGFYRIATTWSSNALEGNTLNISETKVLLEDGLTVSGKPLKDILETSGHANAFDYMFSLLKSNDITEENILTIHRLLYCGIDLEAAGVYRTEPVMVSGSNYPVSAPGEIESNMKQFIIWLKNERKKYHPIIFAAELHRRFVFIHPFLDGNGRTARLLMNTALIQTGYLPCVISPYISSDYISALELSHKEPSRFQAFIAETELETEKDFMRNLNLNLPNFKEAQEP